MPRKFAPAIPFILLFALLYAAFGAASPFLPTLLERQGLSSEQIGIVLGASTAIRLVTGPIAGRIADRTHALRATLAVFCVAVAIVVMAYPLASGFVPLLAVGLAHALALAPTTNLADALALVAAKKESFEYGWVRGAGSAAFIVASILAGFAISSYGLSMIVILQSAMMLAVPFTLRFIPPVVAQGQTQKSSSDGIRALVRLPVFQHVVLVAALILGSHALHDGFSMIRWTAAGISPQTSGVLWSLAVAAEVWFFCWLDLGFWTVWGQR